MRTLRRSLVGTVILVLLGGLGVVATAQDEPGATPVIGNVKSSRNVAMGDHTFGGTHNFLRNAAAEYDMEWSDPRLGSAMRMTTNWDFFLLPEEGDINGAVLVVSSVRLDGPDGAWTGTEYELLDETRSPETYPGPRVMLLSGEGAYEGLSAMIHREYESDAPMGGEQPTFEGYILEGELTPVPAAPELVTADNEEPSLAGEAVAAEEAQGEVASPVPTTVEMAPAVFTGGATCGLGPTEEWLASDPRVTGPCSIAVTSWGSPDTVNIPGAVGDYTVDGPEGDWTGAWVLIGVAPTAPPRNLMVLEGTEAYEGWVVLAWAGAPDGWQEPDPWDLQGIIYEGSAPSLQWPEE